MDSRAIGVYDSGVGGICVLKELQRLLPNENFIYFADTANLPYGNKSTEQIINYSHRIISWLQNEMDVKMIVAACNTSSAIAIDQSLAKFSIPIIGTIQPIISHIMQNNSYKKIGVIATPAACKSKAHENALLSRGFEGRVLSISCPDFVPLIESNQVNSLLMKQRVKEYLASFEQSKLDTLVYGCTHYPLIKNLIENELSDAVQYIDPAEYMALEAKKFIMEDKLQNEAKFPNVDYYCSEAPKVFTQKIFDLWGVRVETNLPTGAY